MTQKLFPLICFFILSVTVSAREIISLNGKWQFNFESQPAAYVTVPHTWNINDGCTGPRSGTGNSGSSVASNVYKRGTGTYTRNIPIAPKSGKRYFIRGEGASIVSEVLINGRSAGTHKGAFTAFCYEITDLLKNGKNNTITVITDNTYNDDVLPLAGDFTMFGGLYRSIELIETDNVCIDPVYYASPGVFITQKSISKRTAKVDVAVRINKKKRHTETSVTVTIKDAEGHIVEMKNTGRDLIADFNIKNPKLWNGRKGPYLYTVEIALTAEDGSRDYVEQPLGLREFEISAKQGAILNGRAWTLHGVNRHQDYSEKGWAVSEIDEKRDIYMMLEMGADALRTAHYPQSENIYDLCDKAGLIVWSEVPAVQIVRDSKQFKENMLLQAKEMILQLGNHPSICMWGIFNEIFHQTTAKDRESDMIGVLKELNDEIHDLDPSRPTVAATNDLSNTELNNIPDHIAANMYPGWYGGSPDGFDNLNDLFKKYSKQGFAISEYGHGADISCHEYPVKPPVPTSVHHPEEWQTEAHERNYKGIKKNRKLWGAFIWNMFDFASAERDEGARPGINDKGLVTYDRKTRKDAFYFYKANWNIEPMVHITSKRYARRPEEQKKIDIKAYANTRNAELFVNGKRIGKRKNPDDLHVLIWKNVSLRQGDNAIRVIGYIQEGNSIDDICTWHIEEED
ncbi:MAG: glycoside hydrolase family 2 TIM barrel-domain containing protein [Bacteroidales bacterium]|nr:glycoside hydrolase family 2 TIM barrel-domain containing protein [Bacteroidales bacterium]